MKTKKIVSIVLAIVMVVSLLPLSAIAQSDLLGKVTGGLFVDDTADPDKSYQYTVVGEDGSTKTVNLLGKNAETGNSVKTESIYYKRVDNPDNVNGNRMIIISKDNLAITNNTEGFVTNKLNPTDHPSRGDIILGSQPKYEWNIENKNNRTLAIKNLEGKYLTISSGGTYSLGSEEFTYEINTNSIDGKTHKIDKGFIKLCHKFNRKAWWGGTEEYWKFIDPHTDGRQLERTEDKVAAHQIKFYQKVFDTDSDIIYSLDVKALDKLIEEASLRIEFENTYTQSSWSNFMHALNAAKEVSKQAKTDIYATEAEAQQALDNIDLKHIELQNAITLLEHDFRGNGKCVTPHIDWERTNESTGLKKDVKTVENDASKYFPLVWNWNDVKDLTTDPNQKVWNVTDGLSAASWSKSCGGDWTTSSVRRFSGTFTWPHGFTLNDKAEIFSVNDGADKQGRYKKIYEYINNNEDLKARYGDSRVIAVNDDMYVFISKADEQVADWNAQQAKEHMIFWTGTSGKGVWSNQERQSIENNGDFGRPELASFEGISATPAFYGYYPNLRDVNDDTLSPESKQWKAFGKDDWMFEHTDYWYAMANTKATMSTLTDLYGADSVLDGQKMRIDVFAFDNSGEGGMDELQIKFCKPDETDVKITIEYYLKNGDAEIKLATTYDNAVDGTTYNLRKGTLKNELDYMKKTASIKAGSGATVQAGRQDKPLKVDKNGENVIKVYYDTDTINTQYFVYDFAGKNEFVYDYGSAFNSVAVNGGINLTARTEGTKIYLTYTPNDSKGSMETAQLTVNLNSEDSKVITMSFIPASNVLYEENFFTIDKFGDGAAAWNKVGSADMSSVVKDNQNSVYGYTENYKDNIGVNGIYKTTVSPSGAKQFSDDLVFSFDGRGFDLIGSCTPTTGTIIVSVRDANNNTVVRNYIVDASYADGEIHQVPLVHCTDLPKGSYSVRVSGVNIDYGQKAAKMSAKKFSLSNSDLNNAAYNALVVKGFTPEEIDKTEFINMNEKINASTFSLRSNESPAVLTASNKDVCIDSFRVYRSSDNASAFDENERNVTYTNILKEGIESSFTAYIEGNKTANTVTVEQYRKMGGPANEIYLMPNTAIAIKVADNLQKTQISVRAVTNGTLMKVNEGSDAIAINHNTEMYYEVTPVDGLIVIANQGDNMLAIDNLKTDIIKISDNDTSKAVMMMTRMMAEPVNAAFVPEKLDVKLNVVNSLFNRYATVKITASPDVEYIEVNGIKRSASNGYLVNWGLAKNKKYYINDNVRKGEKMSFTVVAYDKNGNASEPIVVSK